MEFIEVYLYNSGVSCYILKNDIVGFHTGDYEDTKKPTHILLKGGHELKTTIKIEDLKKELNIDQPKRKDIGWG